MHNISYYKNKNTSNDKTIRCKYNYRKGHSDPICPDKRCKKSPSMSIWVNNAICMKFKKKKGHLSFKCQTKYTYKVIKPQELKHKTENKDATNNVAANE